MIWQPFLIEAIGWGLMLSVMTGPIFFTIIQTALDEGVGSACALVAGQWLSDVFYILFVLFGWEALVYSLQDSVSMQQFRLFLGISGALFISVLGFFLIIKKASWKPSVSKKEYSFNFIKGFLINTLTPFPVFFWISMMTSLITRGISGKQAILFLGVILIVVILTDLIKVYGAAQIRNYITEKYVQISRKLIGLALILSGIILLVKTL